MHACAPLPSTSRPRRFQQSQNHSHCIPTCHKSSSVLDIIVTRALSPHSNECLSPRRTSYFMTSSASSAGLMSTQRPRGAACAACAVCAVCAFSTGITRARDRVRGSRVIFASSCAPLVLLLHRSLAVASPRSNRPRPTKCTTGGLRARARVRACVPECRITVRCVPI